MNIWFPNAAGLLLLFLGAETLVRGSATLALRFQARPLFMGLTLVAFGTSAPELVVSMKTAFSGHADIAVGTVVGSNIFNIAFILGICALIRPLRAMAKSTQVDGPVLALATFLVPIYFWGDRIFDRSEGVFLVLGILAYFWTTLHFSRTEVETAAYQRVWIRAVPIRRNSLWLSGLLILVGILSLHFGSKIFLKGIFGLQREFGVSESVLGLTLAAAGTSLPEVVTSIWAVLRGEDDLAFGNIIGSNVFNALFILGASALVRPLHPAGIQWTDIFAMVFFALLLIPFTYGRNILNRWAGAVLLLFYAGYLALRFA